MFTFKSYISNLIESKRKESEDSAEYEGLCDIFNHHLYANTIDPKLEKHMKENAGKTRVNLREEKAESAHKKLTQRMAGPSSNPEAQNDVDNAVKAALKRHVTAYGSEMGQPLSRSSATEESRKAVEEHYKKTPEEQDKALKEAAKRIGYVAYGDKNMSPKDVGSRLSGGNKKTDTVVNNPIARYRGRLTNSVSSYGGAPGAYTHFHNSGGTRTSHVVQCPHGTTGCMVGQLMQKAKKVLRVGASCLAMSGGYGFKSTRKKVQINSHIRSGSQTAADHAILVAHHLSNEAAKAEKKGQVHAVRTQTTDQRGDDIRAIANEAAKHNPHIATSTVLFGYSKNPEEVLRAARNTQKGTGSNTNVNEHIVHSHPGPAIHVDENGNHHLNMENISALKKLRAAHKTAESEGLHTSDYIVAGGRSLDPNGHGIVGTVHRQPKSNAKAEEKTRFNNTDSSVKRVRYWDLHHSGELKPGEKDSHHNEKTGKGYATIVQNGKKLKIGYYDRKANPGATKSGHTAYEQRHDARYADAENNASYSHVTAPVASTSNLAAAAEHSDSLMHQMHVSHDMHGTRLRHSLPGTLHDAHPDLMQKAGYVYGDK